MWNDLIVVLNRAYAHAHEVRDACFSHFRLNDVDATVFQTATHAERSAPFAIPLPRQGHTGLLGNICQSGNILRDSGRLGKPGVQRFQRVDQLDCIPN
ncbi:MAG: hypothetical protein OXB95_13785 [Rhodobacteraceae bacterium]|nr:hypothetical protein [Paracoccaceae bacterium]